MRDDLEFQINFIKAVESNPSIYDQNRGDYNDRSVTQKIWRRIGRTFNESPEDCKSKWKGIRSSYTRSLHGKSPSGSAAKEYYLAPYLHFLKPYIKSRDPLIILDNFTSKTSDTEEITFKITDVRGGVSSPSLTTEVPEYEENSDSSMDTQEYKTVQASKRKSSLENGFDQRNLEYSGKRRRKAHCKSTTSDDPCELFLLSLLPSMRSMSNAQQLTFKIGVLELTQKILYSQGDEGGS